MEVIKFLPRVTGEDKKNIALKNNMVPCVIYGKNYKPQSMSVDSKIISSFIKDNGFYSKIFSVELNGKTEKVLPKEVQFHPVSNNIIHLDFMRVQDTTKVTVEVPINFLNRDTCPGIKQGGVLNIVRRVVELSCSANQIPEKLEFDLIDSQIGDSIKISNIVLPENVKPTITDRNFVIATLAPPTIEVEPEKTAEEVAEEGEGEKTGEGADKEEITESKKEEKAEDKKEDSK